MKKIWTTGDSVQSGDQLIDPSTGHEVKIVKQLRHHKNVTYLAEPVLLSGNIIVELPEIQDIEVWR